MDNANIVFLKTPRSKNAPINTRPNLEEDYLDKNRSVQRGNEDRRGGKKKRVAREGNSFETSVYYQ